VFLAHQLVAVILPRPAPAMRQPHRIKICPVINIRLRLSFVDPPAHHAPLTGRNPLNFVDRSRNAEPSTNPAGNFNARINLV
jgi:hypothetical protein